MGQKKFHTGLKDKFKIYHFLETVIEQTEEEKAEGICNYQLGWNDTRVAEKLKDVVNNITPSNVAHVRTELFGKISRPQTRLDAVAAAEVSTRVERLEAMLRNLYDACGEGYDMTYNRLFPNK